MPLNAEPLSTDSRQEFCLALKTARERNGITLAQIADTTKIPASLFAALERNDLRRWPRGLFRRSFFRDYARTIGVPVVEACDQFVRLFPEDESAGSTKVVGAAEVADDAADVRLMFDPAWHGTRESVLSRLLAAAVDAGAIILVAAALAWVAGIGRPVAIAIVALAYSSLATALIGESPAKWALSRRGAFVDALRRGADAVSHVFEKAKGATAEPEEGPHVRAWVTDARRVASAPPPRLRVRFKLSQ